MDVIGYMSGKGFLKVTQDLSSCLIEDGTLVMCEKIYGKGVEVIKEAS